MICPNCYKKMKQKTKERFIPDFSGTADDDLFEEYHIYKCSECKIKYNDYTEIWNIPKILLPTDKQKNTILFINNKLNLQLPVLTKEQCKKDINKYFNIAKMEYDNDFENDMSDMYERTEEYY